MRFSVQHQCSYRRLAFVSPEAGDEITCPTRRAESVRHIARLEVTSSYFGRTRVER